MKTNHSYKLIEGLFNPLEAQKILLDLINAKIDYHNLEAFSNKIRFNTDLSISENRIEQLSQTRNSIMALIEFAKENNMELKISSDILIQLIEKQNKI